MLQEVQDEALHDFKYIYYYYLQPQPGRDTALWALSLGKPHSASQLHGATFISEHDAPMS